MRKKRKINNLLIKFISLKIVKWCVIPFILFSLWLLLSLLYSSYKSFTVLQYAYNNDKNNNFTERRLMKGEKLVGQFTAKEKNLGIISVRFGEVPKVDYEKEDVLLFRVKEADKTTWFYENKYKSGLLSSNEFYTFGFPLQTKSKGLTYEFEILSLKGNVHNAVETNNKNPIYISKYKFPKSEVFKNKASLVEFVAKKVLTLGSYPDFLLSSFVFILPLIFYLVLIAFPFKSTTNIQLFNKTEVNGQNLFAVLIFIIVLSDIILYKFSIIGYMMGLIGLWILAIIINHFENKVTFLFALLLLVISIVSIYFNLSISVDKATAYAYFLLLIGFFQAVLQFRKT